MVTEVRCKTLETSFKQSLSKFDYHVATKDVQLTAKLLSLKPGFFARVRTSACVVLASGVAMLPSFWKRQKRRTD